MALALHETLPAVAGRTCEAVLALAYYYRGKPVADDMALVLRLDDGAWHRIFIDAGIVFWQVMAALDSAAEYDRHHYTVTDLGLTHGLIGKRVRDVRTVDLAGGGEVHLVFDGAATVILRNVAGASTVVVH
ncbi:MAG TPA: hypothetical protein VGL09_21025 [Methylomirabilota bacterium]|jgi:hypothetical protein